MVGKQSNEGMKGVEDALAEPGAAAGGRKREGSAVFLRSETVGLDAALGAGAEATEVTVWGGATRVERAEAARTAGVWVVGVAGTRTLVTGVEMTEGVEVTGEGVGVTGEGVEVVRIMGAKGTAAVGIVVAGIRGVARPGIEGALVGAAEVTTVGVVRTFGGGVGAIGVGR